MGGRGGGGIYFGTEKFWFYCLIKKSSKQSVKSLILNNKKPCKLTVMLLISTPDAYLLLEVRGGGRLLEGALIWRGRLFKILQKSWIKYLFFLMINYLKWSKNDLKTCFKQQIGFFEVFTRGRVLLVIFLRFFKLPKMV